MYQLYCNIVDAQFATTSVRDLIYFLAVANPSISSILDDILVRSILYHAFSTFCFVFNIFN